MIAIAEDGSARQPDPRPGIVCEGRVFIQSVILFEMNEASWHRVKAIEFLEDVPRGRRASCL